MRIIIGNRGSGKTTKLVKYAAENGVTILVHDWHMKEYVNHVAREMGTAVLVMSIGEFKSMPPSKRPSKVAIDEISLFMKSLLGADVDCITYDMTQKTELEWLDGGFIPNPVETEDVRDRWDDMMQRCGKVIRECRGVESE